MKVHKSKMLKNLKRGKPLMFRRKLVAILLVVVMFAGLLPVMPQSASAADLPETVTVPASTETTLDNPTGVDADGNVFGGWIAPDGIHYNGGDKVTFDQETELTAAYGHATIEKSVGEVAVTTETNVLRNDYQFTESRYSRSNHCWHGIGFFKC